MLIFKCAALVCGFGDMTAVLNTAHSLVTCAKSTPNTIPPIRLGSFADVESYIGPATNWTAHLVNSELSCLSLLQSNETSDHALQGKLKQLARQALDR